MDRKPIFTHTGYQCSISANAQTQAAWWVNLTEIRSIRNVIIYYRTDDIIWDENNGYTARFMGFYLYVSNTTNIENGYLCFHDTNYTRATIPAVANISCPVHGQYVIYYNERPIKNDNRTEPSVNAHSELCEVEVYGCSSPRHYGRDCSKPCPNNCIDFCHINSGSCNLCTPGFKGSQCEQGKC
ncbi:uncharacterized protein LOC134263876 [Saccostrea cucullata]|uniref:uncharacterized protein LOC134263876 n=1 Tax=Saccostrea cuccullata TaxID=36930 RepID=UPI002ED4401A